MIKHEVSKQSFHLIKNFSLDVQETKIFTTDNFHTKICNGELFPNYSSIYYVVNITKTYPYLTITTPGKQKALRKFAAFFCNAILCLLLLPLVVVIIRSSDVVSFVGLINGVASCSTSSSEQ